MFFETARAANSHRPARTDGSQNFVRSDASAEKRVTRSQIIPPGTTKEIRYFVWMPTRSLRHAALDTPMIGGVPELFNLPESTR